MFMKVALVYDRVNKWGGAERVLLALHELFPDAPLYTSVYDPKRAKWASVFKVIPSFLQQIPKASSSHEFLAPLMPVAFEQFSFDEYDLVISITSEAAKGIMTHPGTLHVCYCLTPTRYLWSGYDEYFQNPLFRLLSKPIVRYLRNWDKIAAQRPDAYVAISKEVQGRVKKYYEREAEVIYPPVTLNSKSQTTNPKKISNFKFQISNYFLIVSRLVPYKRIDIAIEAFNRLHLPLVIVGTGSEMGRLRGMAGATIEFVQNLTDTELVRYYTNCTALVFPGIEDFGLSMVEAQSFGKPVVAYKSGGALEVISEGKTGVFFTPQTADGLAKAIQVTDFSAFSKIACQEQAQKFGKERFMTELKNIIERLHQEYKK